MTATSATPTLVSCCHCSKTLSLRPEELGRPMQCPYCSNFFQTDAPPPPAKRPASQAWFLLVNNRRLGPISAKGLVKLAASGKLRPDTWLTRGTSEFWVRAARVKGLTFRRKEGAVRRPDPKTAAPKKDLVTCDCPHCNGKCRIPRPTTLAAFTCPGCKQPFRAATTSVGVVCQRMEPPQHNTVHVGNSPTRME